MDNRITASPISPSVPQSAPTLALRIGAIVQGTVLSHTGQSLELQIGREILTAHLSGNRGVIPKTALFEVLRLGPTPILKILKQEPGMFNNAARELAIEVLPSQEPLKNLLSNMNAARQAHLTQSHGLARGAQAPDLSLLSGKLIKQIENVLPTKDAVITPPGLRDAIKNSGVFFENRLSKSDTSAISNDLKASLLRAYRELRIASNGPPPEHATTPRPASTTAAPINSDAAMTTLLKTIEAGISRIETLQLANHMLRATGQNEMYLEIPFKAGNHTETLQLVIEHEEHADPEHQDAIDKSSTVYLALALTPTEELHAKIIARGERLSVTLWSESERVQRELHRNVDALNATLSAGSLQKPQIDVLAFVRRPMEPVKVFRQILTESA